MNNARAQRGWVHQPEALRWDAPALQHNPRGFHRSLPGYMPTPLREIPEVAAELGVARVFVKDESSRLGLPAFKILGASFAVARELSRRAGADRVLALDELRTRFADSGISLAAATDGNHGRAVAHVAALLALPATIYVPTGVSDAARTAIIDEGARLIELDLGYDDVVTHAADDAGPDVVLIQDTSWPGYEDIPQWIVDGYDTMLAEVDEQLVVAGAERLDLVVVPAGVGSFAQAVIAHYRRDGHRPQILVAEPDTAASVTAALTVGRIVTVPTGNTVMTGLNCGTVSEIAWPAIRGGLNAAITVTDQDAVTAVGDLRALGVDAGPCGAASLAAARAVITDPTRRGQLRLSADAVVVLLSTEGHAANPKGL